MKKGFYLIIIITLVFIIILGGTACMSNPKELESTHSPTSNVQPSETINPTQATEPAAYSDKQIVEAVYTDYYGFSKKDNVYYANLATSKAEKLPDRYLGSITSEEDVKEKAEAVWTEIDSGILKYTKKVFENDKQSYIVTSFYNNYDVWFARTRTSGITEDGESFGLTGGFSIVLRKSDGKVLAVGY